MQSVLPFSDSLYHILLAAGLFLFGIETQRDSVGLFDGDAILILRSTNKNWS